jgi:hypothetical protein
MGARNSDSFMLHPVKHRVFFYLLPKKSFRNYFHLKFSLSQISNQNNFLARRNIAKWEWGGGTFSGTPFPKLLLWLEPPILFDCKY